MKKIICFFMIIVLLLCLGACAAAPAEPTPHPLSVEGRSWSRVTVGDKACYVMEQVPYCTSPADPAVQFVDIYVPEAYLTALEDGSCILNQDGVVTNAAGTSYTAATAPVILQNSIDAYKQSDPIVLSDERRGGGVGTYFDFVDSGYVLVSVACRGVTSTVDGTAPAAIVDLKAAVRMLKANDALLPGDMNKIIATGGSAGGGCASLLGASGNSSLYTALLQEMGTAMDYTDDVFAVAAYCPITNLDTADGAFEWLHSTETQLAPVNHGTDGGRDDGVEHNDAIDAVQLDDLGIALQELLYDQFLADLESYGLDPDAYYNGFLEQINACIQDYLTRNDLDPAAFVQEYPFLQYDGTTVYAADVAGFVENCMPRSKSVPAFDVLPSGSNENRLFDKEHFSTEVMEALTQLADSFPRAEVYLQRYQEQITEQRLLEVKMMTPNVFLSGQEESDVAPHWRFRIGTNDGDLGASTAWLMTNLLAQCSEVEDVDYGLVWGKPHGTADYSFDDIRSYVDEICTK